MSHTHRHNAPFSCLRLFAQKATLEISYLGTLPRFKHLSTIYIRPYQGIININRTFFINVLINIYAFSGFNPTPTKILSYLNVYVIKVDICFLHIELQYTCWSFNVKMKIYFKQIREKLKKNSSLVQQFSKIYENIFNILCN